LAKPPEKLPGKNDSSPQSKTEDQLVDELTKRIRNLVGKEQSAQVVAQVVSVFQEERFSGPIAHPKHLAEYDRIVPGAGDRIICMAERRLTHQQEMAKSALDADIADTKAGRLYGFLALLALLGCALACGLSGREILAGGFLGVGLAGIIGMFIKGKNGK